MNYDVEMGTGALICKPSFIMIGSAIQKLIGEKHIPTHMHTHRQQGDIITLLLFFFKLRKEGQQE
jgi:hypothetical protein